MAQHLYNHEERETMMGLERSLDIRWNIAKDLGKLNDLNGAAKSLNEFLS